MHCFNLFFDCSGILHELLYGPDDTFGSSIQFSTRRPRSTSLHILVSVLSWTARPVFLFRVHCEHGWCSGTIPCACCSLVPPRRSRNREAVNGLDQCLVPPSPSPDTVLQRSMFRSPRRWFSYFSFLPVTDSPSSTHVFAFGPEGYARCGFDDLWAIGVLVCGSASSRAPQDPGMDCLVPPEPMVFLETSRQA